MILIIKYYKTKLKKNNMSTEIKKTMGFILLNNVKDAEEYPILLIQILIVPLTHA